jgi:hypothetical protein
MTRGNASGSGPRRVGSGENRARPPRPMPSVPVGAGVIAPRTPSFMAPSGQIPNPASGTTATTPGGGSTSALPGLMAGLLGAGLGAGPSGFASASALMPGMDPSMPVTPAVQAAIVPISRRAQEALSFFQAQGETQAGGAQTQTQPPTSIPRVSRRPSGTVNAGSSLVPPSAPVAPAPVAGPSTAAASSGVNAMDSVEGPPAPALSTDDANTTNTGTEARNPRLGAYLRSLPDEHLDIFIEAWAEALASIPPDMAVTPATRVRDVPGLMDVFARALERRGAIVPPREDANANAMGEGSNAAEATTTMAPDPPPPTMNAATVTAAPATQPGGGFVGADVDAADDFERQFEGWFREPPRAPALMQDQAPTPPQGHTQTQTQRPVPAPERPRPEQRPAQPQPAASGQPAEMISNLTRPLPEELLPSSSSARPPSRPPRTTTAIHRRTVTPPVVPARTSPPPLPVAGGGGTTGPGLRDAYTNLLGRLANQNGNPQVRDRAPARLGMNVAGSGVVANAGGGANVPNSPITSLNQNMNTIMQTQQQLQAQAAFLQQQQQMLVQLQRERGQQTMLRELQRQQQQQLLREREQAQMRERDGERQMPMPWLRQQDNMDLERLGMSMRGDGQGLVESVSAVSSRLWLFLPVVLTRISLVDSIHSQRRWSWNTAPA